MRHLSSGDIAAKHLVLLTFTLSSAILGRNRSLANTPGAITQPSSTKTDSPSCSEGWGNITKAGKLGIATILFIWLTSSIKTLGTWKCITKIVASLEGAIQQLCWGGTWLCLEGSTPKRTIWMTLCTSTWSSCGGTIRSIGWRGKSWKHFWTMGLQNMQLSPHSNTGKATLSTPQIIKSMKEFSSSEALIQMRSPTFCSNWCSTSLCQLSGKSSFRATTRHPWIP